MDYSRKEEINTVLNLSVVSTLCVLVFVNWYVNNEHWVHFWDSWSYWNNFKYFTDLLKSDYKEAFQLLMNSLNSDFNLTSMLYLSPISIFGNSRLVYICGLVFIFGSCVVYTLYLILQALYRDESKSRLLLVSILACFFCVTLWRPVLLGLPGIGGAALVNLIIYLFIKGNIEQGKESLKSFVYLGALLTALMLFRRWYGYWIVSFFIIAPICSVVFYTQFKTKKIRKFILYYIISGIFSLSLLLALSFHWVLSMLHTDYTALYSAYRFGNWYKQLISMVSLPTIIMMFIGMLILFKRNIPISIFIASQSLFTAYIFLNTQDFSVQHYYLLSPIILLSVSTVIIQCFDKNILKKNIAMILTLFYIATFLYVFTPLLDRFFPDENIVAQQQRPPFRSDIQEIHRVSDYVVSLLKGNTEQIYILASSGVLNDDILRNTIELPDIKKRVVQIKHIDVRDGFPIRLFEAKYLLIPSKPQFHLSYNSQRIITFMGEQVYEGSRFGKAYEPIGGKYTLKDGVQYQLYKKVRGILASDIELLLDLFKGWYPNNNLFDIDTNDCSLFNIELVQDTIGVIENNCSSIFMHPGENPVIVGLYPLDTPAEIKFDAQFRNYEKIERSCGPQSGSVDLSIYINKKISHHASYSYTDDTPVKIEVPKNMPVKVVVSKGKYGVNCDWFILDNFKVERVGGRATIKG